MKKILSISLIVLLTAVPAAFSISVDESTSQQYIKKHGYSDEMARLIDLQNAQINGENTKYISNQPALYQDKRVNFIRRFFMYFDCGLDDGNFMQNSIDYTTRWDDF